MDTNGYWAGFGGKGVPFQKPSWVSLGLVTMGNLCCEANLLVLSLRNWHSTDVRTVMPFPK